MAAVATKPRSPFGELLRAALDEKGMTIRGLARKLAEENGREPEAARRMLQRYMANGEVVPSHHVRNEIADALEVDRGRFAIDRDQEARQQRLMAALQPLAEELLALATEARERGAK